MAAGQTAWITSPLNRPTDTLPPPKALLPFMGTWGGNKALSSTDCFQWGKCVFLYKHLVTPTGYCGTWNSHPWSVVSCDGSGSVIYIQFPGLTIIRSKYLYTHTARWVQNNFGELVSYQQQLPSGLQFHSISTYTRTRLDFLRTLMLSREISDPGKSKVLSLILCKRLNCTSWQRGQKHDWTRALMLGHLL